MVPHCSYSTSAGNSSLRSCQSRWEYRVKAHSGGGGAAADDVTIDDGNSQAAAGELVRARRAYNSGAHNHHIISCVGHGFSFASRYFELV